MGRAFPRNLMNRPHSWSTPLETSTSPSGETTAFERWIPLGNVTTLAGNGVAGYQDGTGGPAGTAEFNQPGGVALDAAGNVLVADSSNGRIRRIDSDGNVTTVAGNGPKLELNEPRGIAVDAAEDIYVADFGDNTIHKLTPK